MSVKIWRSTKRPIANGWSRDWPARLQRWAIVWSPRLRPALEVVQRGCEGEAACARTVTTWPQAHATAREAVAGRGRVFVTHQTGIRKKRKRLATLHATTGAFLENAVRPSSDFLASTLS